MQAAHVRSKVTLRLINIGLQLDLAVWYHVLHMVVNPFAAAQPWHNRSKMG